MRPPGILRGGEIPEPCDPGSGGGGRRCLRIPEYGYEMISLNPHGGGAVQPWEGFNLD